ncbi:MAG: uracil-DNA glycosylase [Gammaproteobacteria bacterium]|nr:uracil-DNA glycosylase [Gammaproteobacteria bacterium]
MDESLRRTYLDAMGIQVWEQRDGPLLGEGLALEEERPGNNVEHQHQVQIDVQDLGWEALQQQVASCVGCDLHTSRTQTVFGVGNQNADLLIIGEAPGADEDQQGEPFVGRAGKLLNEMLLAIGLERRAVYIANILKCRPPENRDPQVAEVFACEPYLRRQVQLIKPKLILAVGRVAAQNLLKTETKIGKLRGQQYVYPDTDIPVVVTYHPAYLLRSPMEKRKSWQDLLMVKDVLGSDGQ